MADGQQVGGVVGFMKSLGSLIESHKSSECIVVWEGGGSLRRRSIYPDYKSKRKPQKLNRFHEGDIPDSVENRNWQVNFLVACLKCIPIRQLYISDCEADDIIGYAAKYSFKDNRVVIVSSDHDYLQLVSDRITVWSPTLKSHVNTAWVKERYGVLPHNLCVARCFSGDASDAVQGLAGVGVQTLVKRFPQLADDRKIEIEEIINSAKNHPRASTLKALKSIIEGEEIVKRNWRLMHLDVSNLSGNQIGKLNSALEIERPKGNKLELMRTLIKHGIKTFDIDRFYLQVTANIQK